MPRRPRSARADGDARRRRATSAPALAQGARRVGVGVRRDDDEDRRLRRGSRSSCESSGRRARRSKTTRSGWRAASTSRAVSSGSSARTVPMPTATASDSARQRWTSSRLASPEIQGESPGGRRGAAVERHRQLQGDQRQAGAGVLAEGLVEEARGGRLLAGGEARPRRRRRGGCPGPRPAAFSEGSSEAITTRAMPGLEDRLDAGRLAPLVGAGLERHVHRRPGRVLAARGGSRRAPPAPRAGRRARRGSPRRSPRRRATITAPTSGLGLTLPRPPSASSSARRMWA